MQCEVQHEAVNIFVFEIEDNKIFWKYYNL